MPTFLNPVLDSTASGASAIGSAAGQVVGSGLSVLGARDVTEEQSQPVSLEDSRNQISNVLMVGAIIGGLLWYMNSSQPQFPQAMMPIA